MSNETPKEKADRLKVPLIPKPIPLTKVEVSPNNLENELFKKTFINKVEAICESCGKEITVLGRKEPCGREDCPFGTLRM